MVTVFSPRNIALFNLVAIRSIRKLILGIKNKTISNENAIQEINLIKRTYLVPIIKDPAHYENMLKTLKDSKEQYAMSLLSDAQEELGGDFGYLNPKAIITLKRVLRILEGRYILMELL